MKRIYSDREIFESLPESLKGFTIIDVGCGEGELVRWLASKGAQVHGVEQESMLTKASAHEKVNGENYCPGGGEKLPFGDKTADIILYMASFHHIPMEMMDKALKECCRVLKDTGTAWLLEPVYDPEGYSKLVNLLNNEEEVLNTALKAINSSESAGLSGSEDEYYFFERNIEDYKASVELHVDDEELRNTSIETAYKITEELAASKGIETKDYIYRSTCRLRKLKKI